MSTTPGLLRLLGAAAGADLRADLRRAAAHHHPRDPDPRRDRRLAPRRRRSWSACVGVIVVLRPGATDLAAGHLAALAAAVFSAIAAVIVRKIGHEERSAVLLLYPMVANFLVMGCAMPFVYRPMPAVDLGGAGADGLPRLPRRALPHRRLPRRQRRRRRADAVFADPLGGALRRRLLRRDPGLEHRPRRGDHHPLRHLRGVPRGPGRIEEPAGARDPLALRHRHLSADLVGVPAVPARPAEPCAGGGRRIKQRPVSECSAAW